MTMRNLAERLVRALRAAVATWTHPRRVVRQKTRHPTLSVLHEARPPARRRRSWWLTLLGKASR